MDTACRAVVKRRRGKLGLLGKRENFVQALFRTEHQFAPGKFNSIPAEPGAPRIKPDVDGWAALFRDGGTRRRHTHTPQLQTPATRTAFAARPDKPASESITGFVG
jgi:hypothetical protein